MTRQNHDVVRRVASMGIRVCVLALGCFITPGIGRCENPTNKVPATLRQLERSRLDAVHEARQELEKTRSPMLSHGVYEDYRAMICGEAPEAEQTQWTRQDLLAAARKAGVRVVLFAEQDRPKPDAWRGVREGVLFVPGADAGDGALLFNFFSADKRPLSPNGVRFLAQTTERADTANRQLVGMEISGRQFDRKVDKDLERYLAGAAADAKRRQMLLEDWQALPDEFMAAWTNHHPETLTNWDEETEKRPFTGIGLGVIGEKAFLEGEKFDLIEPNFRSVVTHILAQELTEPQIYDALTNGHAYVAHDWLCDPTGFSFGAVNNLGVFTMGDSAPIQGNTRVVGTTPVPARLRLIHKGEVVEETTGTNLTFQAKQPGPYRLEAWLTVDGEDRPWIYSNPVYLRNPGPGDLRPPPAADWDKVDARKNITYREGPEEDSAKHKLDVYGPSGKSNSPVLFFIHGGAWKSGDRGLYPMLGNRFARAGFVTVVPSYRLAPKYPHPAQIEDVAAAFAWTFRHVGEFNGDTNRIYVAGHSAGGHLAALLSLDDRQLAPYHLSPKIIRGVLALSGVYNLTIGETLESVFGKDPQRRREASPLFQIKAGAPRFLVSYCQWDYLTLPAQARQLSRALQQAGVASELFYLPRENHISEMVTISREDAALAAAMLKFMNH